MNSDLLLITNFVCILTLPYSLNLFIFQSFGNSLAMSSDVVNIQLSHLVEYVGEVLIKLADIKDNPGDGEPHSSRGMMLILLNIKYNCLMIKVSGFLIPSKWPS